LNYARVEVDVGSEGGKSKISFNLHLDILPGRFCNEWKELLDKLSQFRGKFNWKLFSWKRADGEEVRFGIVGRWKSWRFCWDFQYKKEVFNWQVFRRFFIHPESLQLLEVWRLKLEV
jgi:hypothetical protein